MGQLGAEPFELAESGWVEPLFAGDGQRLLLHGLDPALGRGVDDSLARGLWHQEPQAGEGEGRQDERRWSAERERREGHALEPLVELELPLADRQLEAGQQQPAQARLAIGHHGRLRLGEGDTPPQPKHRASHRRDATQRSHHGNSLVHQEPPDDEGCGREPGRSHGGLSERLQVEAPPEAGNPQPNRILSSRFTGGHGEDQRSRESRQV